MQTKEAEVVAIGGLILGVGCYSYIASWAMMPIYLLDHVGGVVAGRSRLAVIAVSAIAFAIPVSLAPVWVALHPDMLADTVTRYGATEGPQYRCWRPT